MADFECRTCGAINSRVCNGDNEVCIECGTPDDFEELDYEEEGLHRFDDKLGEKV